MCNNCKANHSSAYRQCDVYLKTELALRLRYNKQCNFKEALRKVDANYDLHDKLTWPPLPSNKLTRQHTQTQESPELTVKEVEKICDKICTATESSLQKKIDTHFIDIQDKIVTHQFEVENKALAQTASVNEDFTQRFSKIQTALTELCTIISTIISALPKNRFDQASTKTKLNKLWTDVISEIFHEDVEPD